MKKYTNFYFMILILIMLCFPQFLVAEGGSNNPEVTITKTVSVNEGNSGTKKVYFTISVNKCPDLSPILLKYTTSNGSAKEGEDYKQKSGTIQFYTPSWMGYGSCTKSYTKSVTINGDTDVEPNETFYVQLSDNGTNSYQKYHFGNQRSTITIKNDDKAQAPKSADLSITKSNDKSNSVAIGDIITYTIVGKNNGPDSSKIYIWDTMPDDLNFISASDNRSNFSCNYNSSDRKVRCKGSRVFNKNDSVTITVKAKVAKNNSNIIKNYAGIKSANSPKVKDPDSSNNKAKSFVKSKSADLGANKQVRKGNSGSFADSVSCKLNDILTFKIRFGNYGQSASRIYLEDNVPSSLDVQSIYTYNKPSNYNCSINNNKVTCSGSHKFSKNKVMMLYIKAKAIKKGRVYNTVKVSSPDGIREENPKDNKNFARVDIELNGLGTVTASKVPSPADSNGYTVGDIITYTITGTNHGESTRVDISDWLDKNKYKFVSVKSDNNYAVTLNCKTSNSSSTFAMYCASKQKVLKNQSYGIKLKVQLKKAGNICNIASFYKYATNWIWKKDAKSCISVSKPKAKPILNADMFNFELNKPDSVDLKDYTTDKDTPKNKLTYKLLSSLPSGLTMTSDGLISGTYTDSNGTFPKDFNVTVKVSDPDGLSSSDSFIIRIVATNIQANDNYYKIPTNTILNGNLITDSVSGGSHPFNSDMGVNLTLISVSPNSRIKWHNDGSFTFTAPNYKKTFNYKYTIKDKYGQTDYAILKIEVYKPKIDAKNDLLEVAKNTPLSVNVFSDNGYGIDVGDDINVTSYTKPSHGTLYISKDGKLTYTPDNNYIGSDSAKYTITDKYGQTDSANISFKVGVIHQVGYVDFYLVNPPKSRNLIGNYAIIGNSVECITEKKGTFLESNSFNGTCQNNRNLSNNDYMVKYIDVDGDSGIGKSTWNSSSATFTLPQSFLNLSQGKGIAWAGLFWQGSLNGRFGFKQRYAYVQNSSSFNFKPISSNMSIDLSSTGADKVLIRIDNSSSYKKITADTFYNDKAHGILGGYYAAYTNITSILQQAKLSKGKHTITVANIMTNEGREANVGNYGGWSLVIIYKEDMTGRARNISIYNGYQAMGKGGNTKISQKELTISGFKLPKSGVVKSSVGAFVGEGEKKYGGSSIVYDKMYIKDPNNNNKVYDMPASDPNNIFDAYIDNIVRVGGNDNNISNTNGIDIDSYNVSNIMKSIRDHDINTNKIVIGIVSKDNDLTDGKDDSDYVTASMLAFSTELYAPKICYDADIKIGKYVDIESQDRNFTASKLDNEPLQTKVMIKSQEADFDLLDSKLKLKFIPNNVFTYEKGLSKTSLPNTYQYYNAIETDANAGEIAIGSNPTKNGGVIGAKELTYSKLYYKFNKSNFQGKFDIFVDAKISFDGVNKVGYVLSTQAPKGSIFHIGRCSSNPTYDAVYGMFNIERGDSSFSQSEEQRYSLYTQVVGVPYEVSIATYKKDSNGEYKSQAKTNTTVELELIDASSFENNSSAGYDSICKDPDTYNMGKFVKFNNNSREKVKIPDDFPIVNGKTTYPENLALKNAAFRVWVLTKKVGNKNIVVTHNCSSQSDSNCFDKLYKSTYFATSNGVCSSECSNSSGTECYDCLRKNFSIPICSRDNFAIRPESYHIALSDNNETNSKTKIDILENSSNATANLVAGYLYHLDVNATKFKDKDNVFGYYLNVVGDETIKKAQSIFNGSSSCMDKANHDLNIYMLNGKTIGFESLADNNTTPKNGLLLNNSGKYKLHIEDTEWTKVDQKGYAYKPFKNHADCIDNSTSVNNGLLNSTRGCDIKSNYSGSYYDLNVNMHPYTFDLNSINSNSNPNGSVDYIYINDLNKTTNLIANGSVMAININGNIRALGKNSKVLTNYTNSCSANSLDIALTYNTLKDGNITTITDILGNSAQLQYSLYVDNIDTSVNVSNAPSNKVKINFNKKYFDNNISSAGSALFNSYFNYKRTYNGAINPFNLHFGILDLTSPKDKSSVDLIKNYIPKAQKDLNSTKTVYYAKVKSQSDFYDDIDTKIIKTPILVSLFCNESLEYCEKYGIDTKKDVTSEYDWWVSRKHSSTAGEGKADLTTNDTSKVVVYPTTVDNFINGIDKDVKIQDVGVTNKPYTATILPTNNMIANYPWLLFNKSKDTVPDYIYKVKFVDIPSAWSGKGKTGHTINVNASGRKSKKVDW